MDSISAIWCAMEWGTAADWFVGLATLLLAIVAIAQDWIRSWFYKAELEVSCKTEPPDCHAVPITLRDGSLVGNSYYLRLKVKSVGNAAAKNVEVFAERLRRERADGTSEPVHEFPPMNLKWSHLGTMYFPIIGAGSGRLCDLGHITDPTRRAAINEEATRLGLTHQQVSLAFDVIAAPNHRGHIIGPGNYELDVTIAAENVAPMRRTVEIRLAGPWSADESTMLRDYVGVAVKQR
jgi:hypothetical protein